MSAENTAGRDTYRRLLEAVYRRWQPDKLKNVGGLMQKYKGQEKDVYVKAVEMYVFSQDKRYWQPLIFRMYQRFNPSKLATFDQVLEKYQGQELQLYKALCNKYISALTADDAPLEIYEWPSVEKIIDSDAADDRDDEASDSPQASACTPVGRRAGGRSEGQTPTSLAEQSPDRGSESSDANQALGTARAQAGEMAASASSRALEGLKTTRPKASARAPKVNGAAQAVEGVRGAAPKARRRAPQPSGALPSQDEHRGLSHHSPECDSEKGARTRRRSLPENGSSHNLRRVELTPAKGPMQPEQDFRLQPDAEDPESPALRRRHRRGNVVLRPAPQGRERSRSREAMPARTRRRAAGEEPSQSLVDRDTGGSSRPHDEQRDNGVPAAAANHGHQASSLGGETGSAERRVARSRRRRRQREADDAMLAADGNEPLHSPRGALSPVPLSRPPRPRSGDVLQHTVSESLQAFVGAAPRDQDTELPQDLVEAEVEYRGEKVSFLLPRTTTLNDVAEMYGTWAQALGGAAPQ